jgi:hypothetical protein
MAYALLQTQDKILAAVFVVDERTDGTVVVLRCDAIDAEGPDGVVIPSEPRRRRRFRYPLPNREAKAAASRLGHENIRIVRLDTSKMPRGPLVFALDPFLRQLQETREPVINLDRDNAERWGWREDARPPEAFA